MIRATAASWLPPLLAHVWESTIFVVLMLLVLAMLRNRLTAGARCAIALIGIAKFAIPSAALRALVPLRPAPLTLSLRSIGGALQLPAVQLAAPSTWPVVLIAIWFAVALLVIVRVGVTRHRLVTIAVRTATPAAPREIEALKRARRRLRIRRSVDIARSALPEAPAVLRVVRPLIVLPARACDDLSDDELEALLCHELAHVARHDNFAARVESFICALFWFHPLIWIAQRVTAMERERACDEVVAGTADERETYLTALEKFCHAAIAPRLPGVSCMATAKLKERIDHIMRFPTFKPRAFSASRVTLAAAAALVVFTLGSAISGTGRAFAKPAADTDKPYSIRLSITKDATGIATLHLAIQDNATHDVLTTATVKLDATRTATNHTTADDYAIDTDVHPDGDRTLLNVTISKDGAVVQKSTMTIAASTGDPSRVYTGQKISMDLRDADLRDVVNTFGKLTGLQMQIDPDVHGKVTVSWHDVPWDEAFEDLINQNGLTWQLHDKVAHISRR
jgi:beta-lactamase regulating signal transducer with metallopeptidase domain